MSARISRRRLLHNTLYGALASSMGLPWLESFGSNLARAQEDLPRRFLVMFSANGTVFDNWVPRGEVEDFELSPILEPLAAHRDDLIIVAGVDQQGAGGDGHQNGIGGMLTGAPLLPGRFAGQASSPAGWADGPSVDQHIAERLDARTPFRSLELGVQVGTADNWGRMCYRARNRPLPPREDPAQVFDDVFGAALLEPAELERRRARRGSILDAVRDDFAALSDRASRADRQRLESHLTFLREVETRLDSQSESLQACDVPERPRAASRDNDDFPAIGELQMDLLALALACGQTQVGSVQWSRSVSNVRFTWLGVPESHHQLSHRSDSDADAQDKLTRINRWYAEQYAYLIDRLKNYEEGEGSLFDQCLLLWCNELGTGNTHSRNDAPYVIAGNGGGPLRTGRFLDYRGEVPHNNLLLSLVNAMGFEDTSFGKPEWCSGPLDGFL